MGRTFPPCRVANRKWHTKNMNVNEVIANRGNQLLKGAGREDVFILMMMSIGHKALTIPFQQQCILRRYSD